MSESSIRADQAAHKITRLISETWRWDFGEYSPVDSWSPAINVYRVGNRVEVAVDLAGVTRESIDVGLEPGALTIRGMRHSPEPGHRANQPMRILLMEIDHGLFCRTIRLPDEVDLDRAESVYRDGLLWVRIPLAAKRPISPSAVAIEEP